MKNFSSLPKVIARSVLEGINHLLWPAVCNICRASVLETDNGLCSDCWGELLQCTGGDYCRRCGRDVSKYAVIASKCANCQDAEIHFDAIARGGVYGGSLRSMILRFKFHDRTELDGRLCMLADSALKGSGFAEEVDFFVPVPLHWRRLMERGYNQSLIICKGLRAGRGQISTDLVRMRNTARQWELSPAGRKRNVEGAFAVRRGHKFSRQRLCLVDDITTSAATLNECAKTLKQAGAQKVFAVVAAVAMQEMDT